MMRDFFGDSDWIRTNDLLLRRQLLYPAELPNRWARSYDFFYSCIVAISD
jgi:hypothetical protein